MSRTSSSALATGCLLSGSRRWRMVVIGSMLHRSGTEIGLDHLGVALHLTGTSVGDLLTVVEDGDPVADSHHDLHVVLDDQHRDVVVADLADEPHEPCLLRRIHPGSRLVEEQ